MIRHNARLVALIAVLVAACAGPTSTITPGPMLTTAELRYALVEAFGPLWFCDPDFYPVARGEEIDAAKERWDEVLADTEAFAAIAARLGVPAAGAATDEQKLAIYRVWKMLNAVALEPTDDGAYRFDYLAQPGAGAAEGERVSGSISATGAISTEQRSPAGEPICPICLALGTSIDTPAGPVAVARLHTGDTVWTLDTTGRRVAGTVIATGWTPAPADHHVVRLLLADGRSVVASPGHPLADGRLLGDLRVGDAVDGSIVQATTLARYTDGVTFDIVVSGPTGAYLAGGIPLASTMD